MNGELIVFAGASALAILSALAMLFQRTPVKSVLSLVVTFFCLAVLSILLAAPFIAVLQMIVYAGAILVLFLFVIMLLNLTEEAAEKETRLVHRFLSVAGVLALGGILVGVAWRAGPPPVPVSPSANVIPAAGTNGEIPLLGRLLFTDYLYAFEITSLLIVAALVGALALAGKKEGE